MAIAILLAVAALFIRLWLQAALGNRAFYITFFLATAISAALAGFWPGILTAIAGGLLGGFVVPAGGWGHLIDPADPFSLFRYIVAGVFVCGDMTRGQSLIVWAIAEGRAAAASVDRFLMGDTALPAPLVPGQLALR